MKKESIQEMPNGKGGLSPYACSAVYRPLITATEMAKAVEGFTGLGKARNNEEFLALIDKKGFPYKTKNIKLNSLV